MSTHPEPNAILVGGLWMRVKAGTWREDADEIIFECDIIDVPHAPTASDLLGNVREIMIVPRQAIQARAFHH